MKKIFNKKMMVNIEDDINWKEAIHQGVELLVKSGYAKPELANAIFKITKKYGAYYVLEKGIALLHAPPGPYAIKAGTSTLLLKNNIQFNSENKWAKIIITLSAPDNESHIEFIEDFGRLFTNNEIKNKLLKAKSVKELLTIAQK